MYLNKGSKNIGYSQYLLEHECLQIVSWKIYKSNLQQQVVLGETFTHTQLTPLLFSLVLEHFLNTCSFFYIFKVITLSS